MPRNGSPANTVMRDVVSGDDSGVYYLLISSLPFGTRWQTFKDWVREGGCEVDHVEVFQKSTNGWVRLIGRENFDLALRTQVTLRTSPFAGREIIVDERNKREPIKILELIDDPPPKPSTHAEVRLFSLLAKPKMAFVDGDHRTELRASQCPSTTISRLHSQPVMHSTPLGNAMAPMCTSSHRVHTSPVDLQDCMYTVTVDMPRPMTGFTHKYGLPHAVSPRFCETPPASSGIHCIPPLSTSKLANWHHEGSNASGRSGRVSYGDAAPTRAMAAGPNYNMPQRADDGYYTLRPLSPTSVACRERLKGAGSSERPLENHCNPPVMVNTKGAPAQVVRARNIPAPTKYAPPIEETAAEARKRHLALLRQEKAALHIYIDGSGINGQIDAATVCLTIQQTRSSYMGTEDVLTVYAGELQGISLALDIAQRDRADGFRRNKVIIYTDNQAAIRSSAKLKGKSGAYLLKKIVSQTATLHEHNLPIEIRWVPAHTGVQGNEDADRAAKEATGWRERGATGSRAETPAEVYFFRSTQKTWTHKEAYKAWAARWAAEKRGRTEYHCTPNRPKRSNGYMTD
ncbi:hypothetical protein PCL_01206 [Purpureocillium lilacinum]|uniref:RNase H type-1 domain-containing protein n=1 Tax=Purpureocillium lilacinum TaxID=33203 RepID=A0A2U3DP02_PURLI|nr:hypothetical protein PCL_01206 [Purpureocillium lilacinum]